MGNLSMSVLGTPQIVYEDTSIGTTTLNNNQILIGTGTNAISQSPNLIWNSASNGLGIGVTQLFNLATNFQVNDRT